MMLQGIPPDIPGPPFDPNLFIMNGGAPALVMIPTRLPFGSG